MGSEAHRPSTQHLLYGLCAASSQINYMVWHNTQPTLKCNSVDVPLMSRSVLLTSGWALPYPEENASLCVVVQHWKLLLSLFPTIDPCIALRSLPTTLQACCGRLGRC